MGAERGAEVERDPALHGGGRRRHSASRPDVLVLQQAIGNRAVGGAVQRLQEGLSPRAGSVAGGGEMLVQRGILDWFKKKKAPVVSGPTNARAMKPEEQQGALSGKEVEAKKKEDDRGLTASKLTTDFAGVVLTYWRNPANKDKPLKDLGEYMLAEVNKSLGSIGSYPCNNNMSADDDDAGAFVRSTWTIEMNPAKFTKTGATKVSEITQDDLANLVDTVYHESRHSEQYFRIARIQAGSGKSAAQIKDGVDIPAEVAKAAFEAPMKDEAPNRAMIKEAGAWEAFTIGKYAGYKGKVASLRDATSALEKVLAKHDAKKPRSTWKAMEPKIDAIQKLFDTYFDAKIGAIEKIAKKDLADDVVLKDLKAMKGAWTNLKAEADKKKPSITTLMTLRYALYEARYDAYMDYEHEKDAWAAGGAAGKAFKEAADKPVTK